MQDDGFQEIWKLEKKIRYVCQVPEDSCQIKFKIQTVGNNEILHFEII